MNIQIQNALLVIIASNIKSLRVFRKLTQEDMAKAADISVRTYKRIEHGQSWANFKDVICICTALDVDIDYLTRVHRTRTSGDIIKKFQSPLNH